MSGCLALDETMPALTSRLLLLLEDEDDLLVLKPQSLPTTGMMPRVEECKEESPPTSEYKEESPMVVSPINTKSYHHRHGDNQWSSPRRFHTIPECGLPSIPSCPLPIPNTPVSSKGLFAPLSPIPQDLWQYGDARHSFLTPRTTDAVFEEKRAAVEAAWCSPEERHGKRQMIPNLPPVAPSLFSVETPSGSNHSRDAIPSVILYRNRGGSFCNAFDDDEVSLLADDPDEDDAGVLPPATYDVVVNLLDEIDRDDN